MFQNLRDEIFEVLSTAHLKVHAKPIALLNIEGHFDPLLAVLDRIGCVAVNVDQAGSGSVAGVARDDGVVRAAADEVHSFAGLPLRTTTTFGLLLLASPDPHRFHAGMGTMFLTRLSELASVAAARFLPS